MVVNDWHMVVNDWHMVRHQGHMVVNDWLVVRPRATVVPQSREFEMVARVADAEDDSKDGDEDENPKESWDNIEDATPTMKLWGR